MPKLVIRILIPLLFLAAFLVRIWFVPYWKTGDVLVFQEWGQKLVKLGPRNFYFNQDWYYSFPTQPPLSSLMYGGAFWLFDHKYVLAQMHNSVKFPPAVFVEWFYNMEDPVNKNGYLLLLKLPAILADILLSLVIFKVVFDLTKSRERALGATSFYLFNPITIFLAGGWGQPESLVALFGLLAFVLLAQDKVYLSTPLFFISLYFKPTWSIFIPLYIFLLFIWRPKIPHILIGILAVFIIFLGATAPFSGQNILGFTKDVVIHNMLPSAKGTARASISAFNFHSFVLQIDKSFDYEKIGIIQARTFGLIVFVLINFFTFSYIKRTQNRMFAAVVALFAIGFGGFLFLTNMLERYFFASFAPIVILLFTKPKILVYILLINIVIFANLIFAFFRRSSDEIGRPFTDHNFLLIRLLSLFSLLSWARILHLLKVVKLVVKF